MASTSTGNGLEFHQDLSPASFDGHGHHRADAAEALARAKAEIARRGLTVTVTKDYYALAVAQRKYATAQQALDEAQHFLDISQAQEREGQSAHSDVVKAQIQFQQQETAFDESRLAMEDARLDLAVLLFPTLNENFSVVDDLDSPTALPTFDEIQAMASRDNPDIRVAIETQREADLDVKTAKNAFLPTLTVDNDYGIEANAIGLNVKQAAFPELGPVPTLGYFLTVALNVPVWDWGTLRSKAHQAEYKQESARVQLSQTQRAIAQRIVCGIQRSFSGPGGRGQASPHSRSCCRKPPAGKPALSGRNLARARGRRRRDNADGGAQCV